MHTHEEALLSRIDLASKNWQTSCFRSFSKKKKNDSQEKFCETLTCKYRKSSKNNKFNKIIDLKREKAKKNLEKSSNFAKIRVIAKVTRIFLV